MKLSMFLCGVVVAGVPVFGGTFESFTLPTPAPGGSISYADVQASFPGVNWATLERLYIPAGHWRSIRLSNLPVRTPDHPLVITNVGGQVVSGGLGGTSHGFLLGGGANWILTGEWDPVAETGDPGFRGHATRYAHSAGTYGIVIDNAFQATGDSGLVVGGGATDFELAFIEVTRVGFAGALIKTDNNGVAHMANVRIHDLYIHDTGSEGIYLGSTQNPPQHKFPQLEIFNNRVVRAGTELIQLGQVGRDSEIHHNVFVWGALDWKNPFGPFQDNGGQFGVREGDAWFHHNILIGGAASFFQFFPQPRDGDTHLPGDTVLFSDNYFSHSRNFGAYLHAQSDLVTAFVFQDNWFRHIDFQYTELDPGASNANQVIRTFNTQSPMTFTGNTWSGPQTFLSSSTPNITATGNNHATEIPPIEFMATGFAADVDYLGLEIWTALDTNGVPVQYGVGDHVVDNGVPGGGTVYRALVANSGVTPGTNASVWAVVPALPDDLRLRPGSPFVGYGLLDVVVVLFEDGFESGSTASWSATAP